MRLYNSCSPFVQMHKIITLLSVLVIITGCNREIHCKVDYSIIMANDSLITKFESDSSGQKWWNDYLRKINEPKLKGEKNESYRLMIYNSMWASSKIYRIYKDSNSYKLVFKEFGGEQIEPKDSKLTSNKEIDLSKKKWTEFQNLLKDTEFWGLPVTMNRMGFDGTTWMLEGRNPDKNNCTNREYHMVSRWQPLDSMKVMKLNRKLVELKEE